MLAIINAHLLTVTHGEIENGTILIKGGKIVGLGADVVIPDEADVIDAEGSFIMPGMIDASAALGLKEEGTRWEGDDRNENTQSPVMPHLRAIDGISPEDVAFQDARELGVTTVLSAPGSANVIGGQGAIIKTYERCTADEMLVKTFGMKAALGEDPKSAWRAAKKLPSTRMGTAAVLREALLKAAEYQKKLDKAKDNPEKAPERDLKNEALAQVIRGEMPLLVHVHRHDDIMTALRIAKEFDIKIILVVATEAHKVADALKAADVPVIVGPISQARMKVETAGRTITTPAVLAEAGVKFAITTDAPSTPVAALIMQAGLAVRGGLTKEEAIKAITLYPAQILGIDCCVGSLEVGKDADIVVLDGHPLQVRTNVIATFIKGELVYEVGDDDCCCGDDEEFGCDCEH